MHPRKDTPIIDAFDLLEASANVRSLSPSSVGLPVLPSLPWLEPFP
jgi:hypothetical protein